MTGGRKELIAIFAATSVLGLAADLATKSWITAWVDARGAAVEVIPGWLQWIHRINPNGMWSIGHQWGGDTNVFLAAFCGFVVLMIAGWAIYSLKEGERGLAVVMGMILGGAVGNLHDRLMFGGVRDFIDAHYYEIYHYPTFNVADSMLVIGAGYLVLVSLLRPQDKDSSIESRPPVVDGTAAGGMNG